MRHRVVVVQRTTGPDQPTTYRATCAPHGHQGTEYPTRDDALTEIRERHVWGGQSYTNGEWHNNPPATP